MAETPENNGRQPIDPAKRRRLQQMFEHGNRSAAKGDFKYATEMFTQCVLGDPSNLLYVTGFLATLQKQYNNNKKGDKLASIKGMTIKGSIKKAVMQRDYNAVFTSGVEMLKLNPWDSYALRSMAEACEAMELDDCQLKYLKAALDADIKDPDINRLAAIALGRMAKYEDAIACWTRVDQARPGNEEARKAIADLHIERTIDKGGYEDAESSTEVMADKAHQDERTGAGVERLTPEQQLNKQIKKDPANTSLYLQLAELHLRKEQFAEAEEVLNKALEVSGGEINVRERLEDTQLRRQKSMIEVAAKRAREDKSKENVEMYQKLKVELNSMELSVYRARCDRYPSNLGLKYKLGILLQNAEMYNEAIKAYQEARSDPQSKGKVLLALGECFQHIKQFKLAMSNYEQALAEIPDREEEDKKLALYRAGKLALGLRELEKAEGYLTQLAGLDFAYKDVAECLDKARQLRDKA